jgi:glyoxylase-like metal-dependent hydrolase (beta-lactamase superfamily II)
VRLAIVYDNSTSDPNLSHGWGFSCLVGDDLLFDSGGDGSRLLSNMGQMALDVDGTKTVVLSHAHGDHSGGLAGLLVLNKNLTVYLPRSFPTSFKKQVRARAKLVEVHEPMEIAGGSGPPARWAMASGSRRWRRKHRRVWWSSQAVPIRGPSKWFAALIKSAETRYTW